MANLIRAKTVSTFIAAVAGGATVLGVNTLGETFFTAEARQPIVIETPRGAPLTFADLIEQVSPAVVSVNVVTEEELPLFNNPIDEFFERFRGTPLPDDEGEGEGEDEDIDPPPPEENFRRGGGVGSGFFISADGYVVTNNHVVENAVEIELVMADGTELEAEIIGVDPETDLAVLKVIGSSAEPFPFVEFSDNADLRVGDWVVAVGNPFGLGGTATAGIVSAKGRRDQPSRSSAYIDFLQVDAAINRGNSGGPTFDLYGRVVGVNTAIISPSGGSVGIGFAIPSETASQIVDRLMRDGKVTRGWLGVTIQSVNEEMADAIDLPSNKGAIVSDLVKDGPASKAGLQRGDIVLGLNGRAVSDSTDLTRQVGSLLAGSTNDFRILRDGQEMVIQVRVDERPSDPSRLDPASAGSGDAPDSESEGVEGPLGVSLYSVNPATREALGLAADETGVVISSLQRRSPLADRGLRPGMVIMEVNFETVATPEAYAEKVTDARADGKDNILLAVRSEGRTIYITIPLDSLDN